MEKRLLRISVVILLSFQFITQREKEILQHMVSGWDAKRIASELNISTLTVRKHIANIYEKLHVNSRAQIIMLATKHKWL